MTAKKINYKFIVSILLIAATFIIFTANVQAYTKPAWVVKDFGGYTGQATTVKNTLNYQNKKGAIRVVEPNWEPVTEVKPGDIVVKDVKVRNGNTVEGFVVIKISIPTIMAKMEGDETEKVYDQFIPDWNTTDYELLYEKKSTVAGTDSVYYYGLSKSLRAGEYSAYVFQTMRVPLFTYVAEEHSDAVVVDAAFINATEPVTKVKMTSVKDAFDIMGDWVPEDYTRK